MAEATTLVDLYEAAGGVASEDRTSVTITGEMQPIRIEMEVSIGSIRFEDDYLCSPSAGRLRPRSHIYVTLQDRWSGAEFEVSLESIRLAGRAK